MLLATATLAASTPAAPLMPQSHGVGPVLITETSRNAGGKSKAHQDACWRQDQNTEAGANEKVCSIKIDQERRQPERQRKQVSGTRHAPG
jgi:hypothetical protein